MYKWKPNKTTATHFVEQMKAIREFCSTNDISTSNSCDSYYFTINNVNYRVSNHAVESRNKYDDWGNLINARGYELDNERQKDVVYIHASKTRIVEIYNNLKIGKILDGNGMVKY